MEKPLRPLGVRITPEIEDMLRSAHSKRYAAKSLIMREGEESLALFYILDGSVTVLMEDEDGDEIILAYLGPGEFFGELGLFGGESRSAWVRARSDTEVAVITYDRFQEMCRAVPELLMQLAGQIAARLRETSRKVGDLAFLDVTGRVAHALLNLTNDSESMTHPDGWLVRITREELGRLVSCSREMAGKVLKDLEDQGLIRVDGKNIVVYGTR
jgi:CRP/FNR family cyclic AMP-dependent transcriptional regulator